MRLMRMPVVLVCLACLFSGCARRKPVPPGRLQLAAGECSFVAPAGWMMTRLRGIDAIIVSTEPDGGARPNIFAGRVLPAATLAEAARQTRAKGREYYPTYDIIAQTDFRTGSGLPGVKITAHRENKEALPVASFAYLVQDGARVISTICICAASVVGTYEPIFDEAMTSMRSERPGLPIADSAPSTM